MRLRFLCLIILLSGITHSQTLADAARMSGKKRNPAVNSDNSNQDKPSSSHGSKPKGKVFTNEDVAEAAHTESSPQSAPSTQPEKAETNKRTAEEWKEIIGGQKAAISSLESQISELEKSIQFVTANAYYNGAEYNAYQKKKQDRVAIMKGNLEKEKAKLASMQDDARKSGFGSTVYD